MRSQKGFIQNSLLIIIIVSVVIVSAGTGVILHKQGKLASLITDISGVFRENKGAPIIKNEELKQGKLQNDQKLQLETEPIEGAVQQEISGDEIVQQEQKSAEKTKPESEIEPIKEETVKPEFIPEVEGCTDPDALNYNPKATKKDGSCEYRKQALTNPLGGNIIQDSKLTLANSPYIVTETIQVLEGVTLEIEPGVVLKFSTTTGMKVGGELLAIGEKDNMIIFTLDGPHRETMISKSGATTIIINYWSEIEFLMGSIDAVFDDNGNYIKGSAIKYSKIEYAKKGIHLRTYTSPFIAYNLIENNQLGIDNYESSPKIFHNTIRNNNIYGGGIYEGGICVLRGGPIITYNNIYDNIQGLFIGIGFSDIIFHNNNIYGNSHKEKEGTSRYDLYVWERYPDQDSLLAQDNYWGTAKTSEVNEKIYDYYDDISLGKALYQPIATSEIPDAGVQQ